MLMNNSVPLCQARSAPLSPPQSALGQEEEVTLEDMEEEDTVEDQDQGALEEDMEDQGAMAPPGGRGGLQTLRVALCMPGVEDAAEEDHQALVMMEDQEVICMSGVTLQR